MASPSRVQAVTFAAANAASKAGTFSSTPTSGNLLIALGIGSTVIGNASLAGFTVAQSALMNATATIALLYKVSAGTESGAQTLNWTSSARTGLYLAEYTGWTNWVLDQIAKTDTTGSGVTSRASGTTPAVTSPTVFGIAACYLAGSITAPTYSNSFTEDMKDLTEGVLMSTREAQIGLAATLTTTFGWTTSRTAGALIATFKADVTKATEEFSTGQYGATQAHTAIVAPRGVCDGRIWPRDHNYRPWPPA